MPLSNYPVGSKWFIRNPYASNTPLGRELLLPVVIVFNDLLLVARFKSSTLDYGWPSEDRKYHTYQNPDYMGGFWGVYPHELTSQITPAGNIYTGDL